MIRSQKLVCGLGKIICAIDVTFVQLKVTTIGLTHGAT
jgi:hypothetical protein